MRKIRRLIALVLIATFGLSLTPSCAGALEKEDSPDYDLSEITKTWQQLSDSELNDYIGNNNDTDIYGFISGLSEEERAVLRGKKTMLNNTISIDNEDGTFEEMPYYDWIMKNGEDVRPMMFRSARGVASTFTAKSGYCFYRFVDNNSGYIVRYKVTFTLDSTANAESEYNNYTVGSVIYVTAGTNSNNTKLNKVTFEKKKTYMKKAATRHVELSDGSAGELRDGERIYPTAITPIFVLTVKVPKPMYTYGEWYTSGFSMNGVEQTLAKGSRFNFAEYNWQCTGDSTFNNKVYHTEQIDTLTSCVNILSCGFTVDNVASLGLAEGVPEIDTINVIYKHPVLNLDFYANGGTVSAAISNSNADNPVHRSVLYNKIYSSEYGLPGVAALGFKRTGYEPVAGAEWKTYDGTKTWNEANLNYRAVGLLDFDDGTYFTKKQRSLYVNWQPKVYKVTLDNQGAEYSGTQATWYRYNNYETETLADGTVQKNYFYTTESLAKPLKKGFYIELPVKAGYEFKGYFKEKNGQGKQYIRKNGAFINQLWKEIGPHTLYAKWEKKAPEIGTLVIRRNLKKSDFYVSHGNATFTFKITSDTGDVYYRTISFDSSDLQSAKDGVITLETSCDLNYGKYTVEAMDVSRYKNKLSSLSSGNIKSAVKGDFELNSTYKEVIAVYSGDKTDWQRFSHNDLCINSLEN